MKPSTLQMCEWFLQAQLLLLALSVLGCAFAAHLEASKPSSLRKADRP